MKKRKKIIICVSVIVILLISSMIYIEIREMNREKNKLNLLRSLGVAIFMYASDHNSGTPATFKDFEPYLKGLPNVSIAEIENNFKIVWTGNLKNVKKPSEQIIIVSKDKKLMLYVDGHVRNYTDGHTSNYTKKIHSNKNMPLLSQGMFYIIIGFCLGVSVLAIYFVKNRKNPKRMKLKMIIAMCLMGIIVVYFLFYTICNMMGRGEVKARLSHMKSLGIPVTHKEILPHIPEDSKNGAILYEAAFRLLEASKEWNKFCTFERTITELHGYDITLWEKQDQEKAIQLLNDKEIDLVFQVFSCGTEKPFAVYKRTYKGFDTLLPNLKWHRTILRLIAMKVSCYRLGGESLSAYELIEKGYKFIIQNQSDPYLICQLINIACASINSKTLKSLISQYGISTPEAIKIFKALDKIDFNRGMKVGLDGELLMNRDIFEGIISGEYPVNQINPFNNMVAIWPFFYQDYAYSINKLQQLRTLLDKPFWEVKPQLEKLVEEPPFPMLISRMTIPGLPQLRTKTAQINSEIYAVKLTLALYVYKNIHGKFPEKLEELLELSVPQKRMFSDEFDKVPLLKTIPLDPMNGKPYEYRIDGNSFKLDSEWLKTLRKKAENKKS